MQLLREVWEQWRIPLALLLVYWVVAAVVVRFVHLRWCRKHRAENPRRYRWVFALILALIFTPSVISDFFLFMIPGPAILGFLLLVPAMVTNVFSDSYTSFAILVTTFVYHLFPMALVCAITYAVLRRQDHRHLSDVTQTV